MPPYNPDAHHRRSIRLKGYNYALAGAYFITLCTRNRDSFFGEVVGHQMLANTYGNIVQEEWSRTALIRQEITLDAFQVMPNHVHGIVLIAPDAIIEAVGAGATNVGATGQSPLHLRPQPPSAQPPHGPARRSLGSFVVGFKTAVTQRINQLRGSHGLPVWQRNYYERIIRNEAELNPVRDYIAGNPAQWAQDEHNPANLRETGTLG
jgi:REP element-mobilizing transposase RayT